MNKITCEVIRDLIPSCMDGIASADSVKLVEEHIAGCTECRNYKKRMETPDFDGRKEEKKLDYMKKIRRMTDLKSAFCIFFILLLVIFFSEYSKSNYRPWLYFGFAPILLLCNYILFFDKKRLPAARRIKTAVINITSLLLTLYSIFLVLVLSRNMAKSNIYPFGMTPETIGPFVYYQLFLIMIIQILLWIKEILCHIRKSCFSIVTSSLGIIGFYMQLFYMQLLKTLTSSDAFDAVCRISVLIFAEGVTLMLVLILIDHIRYSRHKE